MIQVLLQDDYLYDYNHFKLFLQQCNALFKKDISHRVKGLFREQEKIDVYFYCNEDGKIEVFYDTNVEDGYYMLKGYLKTIFNSDEVFEIEKEFDIKLINSLTKYKSNSSYGDDNYTMKGFDFKNTEYILNSLTEHTGIKVSYYYESNDQMKCSLHVFSTEKQLKKQASLISSTIQQITCAEFEGTTKSKKLHVTYNDSKDSYFNVGIDEIMNFIFIPYKFEKILTASKFAKYIDDDIMQEGICIGRSAHPAQKDRYVYIQLETIREHMFISGVTGGGKSAMFEMQTRSIIENNLNIGFTLFDPKKSAVTGVLNNIERTINKGLVTREDAYSKVKVIDFANKNAVFKINLLDKSMDTTVLLNYFREIFKSTGPRLEKIITNSIGLLLNDTKEHYICDVLKLLRNNKYRQEILNRTEKVPEAKIYHDFFMITSEFKEEEISPIENRITPFQKDAHTFEMFNSGNDLEVLKWMDEGYKILFDMSSFSPIEVEIVTGYIELKYYVNSRKRVNNAYPHILYIDESHGVQNGIHEKIQSEGRSQGLHLVLMTQFIKQMKKSIMESTMELSATKITLKQGAACREMATVLGATERELQELDKMVAVVKTAVDGKDVYLSTITDPPYRYDENGDIIEYKIKNNGKTIINPEITRRENELSILASKIMEASYPKANKSDRKEKYHSSGFSLDSSVLIERRKIDEKNSCT